MLLVEFLAQNDSRRLAGARKGYDLVERTFRINRNATGSCLEDTKLGHAPFRRVVTQEHDAIAGLDAFAGKKAGGASS
jgi:hypothetical protein